MDVQFALFADIAETNNLGKVHVFGGGWDTVRATSFPATHLNLGLVARFNFSQSDTGRPQHATIEFLQPDGGHLIDVINAQFDPREDPDDQGRIQPALIAINVQAITFPKPGNYECRITAGSRILTRLPLYVRQIGVAIDPVLMTPSDKTIFAA